MLMNNQWINEEIKREIKKYIEANESKNTLSKVLLEQQLGFPLFVVATELFIVVSKMASCSLASNASLKK